MSEAYPYVYWWNWEGRKGQLCRITVRGKRNTILVEFTDGFTMVTSRWAARKIKVNTVLTPAPASGKKNG